MIAAITHHGAIGGQPMRPGVIAMSADGDTMRLVDVRDLRISDIRPREIAHHLSSITRYGGLPAINKRPTVAQHAVEGAIDCYETVLRERGNVADAILAAQHFVVHDWPEAFTGDVRHPLLLLPELAWLRSLQRAHLALCCEAMGLDPSPPRWVTEAVRRADAEDARREQFWLCPVDAAWGDLRGVNGQQKFAWSQADAKTRLLETISRFLGGEVLL